MLKPRHARVRWREWHDRVRAKTLDAIRRGVLVRQPCEQYGDSKSEAHHDDYGRPLVVRWLCQGCHQGHHAVEDVRKLLIDAVVRNDRERIRAYTMWFHAEWWGEAERIETRRSEAAGPAGRSRGR